MEKSARIAGVRKALAFSFFALGITSLAAQVLLIRELLFVFGGNEFFIGWTLAAWLFWTALGAGLAGRLGDGPGSGPRRLVCGHAFAAAALPALLARSDIVVNLLPLTPATQGLFNASTFACMRRGASLVNLARGGHVVESDLLAALASGGLQHAVLDVFCVEPLPPGHPFWSHPQITVLPHVAALTDPRSAAEVVARNVRALREGRPIEHLVDRARGY